MGRLGPGELLIIGIIALIVFGPRRLPELGKSLGEAIKGFKSAIREAEQQDREDR